MFLKKITLGVPKCYKLLPMPGFIYDLCRSQPARTTRSIVVLYCIGSVLPNVVLISNRDFVKYA